MVSAPKPRIRTLLRNGWRRRCPRCGEGALFTRFIKVRERCSSCNLQFQRNNGDIWMFMIITDRIPILFGIAAVYFGFHPQGWPSILGFFALMAAPLLATMRERTGVALALDYLVRVYLPDPSDEIHGGRGVRVLVEAEHHRVHAERSASLNSHTDLDFSVEKFRRYVSAVWPCNRAEFRINGNLPNSAR